MIFLLALIALFCCCACGNDQPAESPYEKYAKYEDLFECMEAGDLESAQSYLEDFFGVTLRPTVPTTQPTEPTEPTQPPTEPTQPATKPTEPPTEPTEPPTEPTEPPTIPTEPPTEPTDSTEPPAEPTEPSETPDEQTEMVWIPKSGEKYHTRPDCSNMKNPTQVTKEEAEAEGFTPCKRCHE